jgi:hypothetical protein
VRKTFVILVLAVMLMAIGCAENPVVELNNVESEGEIIYDSDLEQLELYLKVYSDNLQEAIDFYKEAEAEGDKEKMENALVTIRILSEEIERIEKEIDKIKDNKR